ncbi:MAG: VWA domain-containing protein [Halioglobus sp.]
MLPELAQLEHFHFLRPAWGLLALVWLAMAWVRRRQRARRDMFGGIIAPHLLEHLRLQRFDSRWFNPSVVSALLVALLLILLMGPSWRQQPSPLSEDEAALVILLDVSSSMRQADVQPSRLQRAKQKISDLIALREDKKTALVVYSGTAHTVLSLTPDREILNQYLAAVKPAIMPRSGKFPEYGLPLIDDILKDSGAPATIVLFSDGLGAASHQRFVDWFATRPHQLLAVGVGSESVGEGGIALERDALENLADETGGTYIALAVDDSDMRRANRRINSHYVIIEDSALPWLDSGYWLVFPAMLLFLLWFRRGWTLTWMWIALPLALHLPAQPAYAEDAAAQGSSVAVQTVPSAEQADGQTDVKTEDQTPSPLLQWFTNLWLTADQQGRILMQMGRYGEAAKHFSDPMWKGMAYYYDEQFMLAAEYFSRTDSDTALFNEANARAQARDYVRAVSRYDRLLAHDADFPGAASNRARVQDIIDEINRISASQQQEAGVGSDEKTLDSEDAIPAQGVDELSWEKAELEQLSADQVLGDEATQAMWLRSVQQDPANFLAIKFSMQLNRAQGSPERTP